MLESERWKKRYEGPERRKGKDPVLHSISVLGAVSWILMIPVFFLIDRARPEVETFIERWQGIVIDPNWDAETFRYAVFLLVIIMVLSAIGLFLSSLRSKRKTDSIRLNLVVVFGLAFVGTAYYLGRFVFS
ncbi:hypothetical protein SAMN05660443_0835 [Marinospirillum celere]|uniref:Uncharacterized protein n=1 Tax=Marinospirillum celere TaxID=1122252 RepID=A0A1I1ET43_9GAMM|nr:hypothetical protein [Marinospirillum celere]SFB90305.1 hypothetical protein SAMN05660443_0835 [Marinospirillum celere]